MQLFSRLFTRLDQTTGTNSKVAALAQYFAEAAPLDRLWTVAILSRRRPKRTVTTTLLRTWAAERSALPPWLFEETYHVVGDLAETIARILPPPVQQSNQPLSYWITYIQSLAGLEEAERRARVIAAWEQLDYTGRFIFNKLITGGFRMGVSQKLMTRALAQYTGIDENTLAHRLMGDWSPDTTTFEQLILIADPNEDISKPYPFYLAHPLETPSEALGAIADWQVERKWDGIRGQVIVRAGEVFVWSRGEELVTPQFPEFHALAAALPDGTVLDGEIMPWQEGQPLPFHLLQTRIGRKQVTKSSLQKAPVILMAYDLLEYQGEDIRNLPLHRRRQLLEALLAANPTAGTVRLSELVVKADWAALQTERTNARAYFSEGLMLKRRDSVYRAGRKRGDWWKWKVDPLTIDAVLLYAQRGHGRRANLFSDFTFAVWDGEDLVPFTRAYSGLTDKELNEITAWVRQHTRERFGPVRSVEVQHVFEIAFEGIQRSGRHKSGVALRFPRISRWRRDKPVAEANTLQDLQAMLEIYGV